MKQNEFSRSRTKHSRVRLVSLLALSVIGFAARPALATDSAWEEALKEAAKLAAEVAEAMAKEIKGKTPAVGPGKPTPAVGPMFDLLTNSFDLVCNAWKTLGKIRFRNAIIAESPLDTPNAELLDKIEKLNDKLEIACAQAEHHHHAPGGGREKGTAAGDEQPDGESDRKREGGRPYDPSEGQIEDAICNRQCESTLTAYRKAMQDARHKSELANNASAAAIDAEKAATELEQRVESAKKTITESKSAQKHADNSEQVRLAKAIRDADDTLRLEGPKATSARSVAKQKSHSAEILGRAAADARTKMLEAFNKYLECLNSCKKRADAYTPKKNEFRVGMLLGGGQGFGDYEKGNPIRESTKGLLAGIVSADYTFSRNLHAGLYGQYGPVLTGTCYGLSGCSGSEIRFGIKGEYHYALARNVEGFVGIGIGRELATLSSKLFGAQVSSTAGGWDLSAQLGAQYRVTPGLTVGPVLVFTLGRFDAVTASSSQDSYSRDIEDKRFHGWMMLGVGGNYGFAL